MKKQSKPVLLLFFFKHLFLFLSHFPSRSRSAPQKTPTSPNNTTNPPLFRLYLKDSVGHWTFSVYVPPSSLSPPPYQSFIHLDSISKLLMCPFFIRFIIYFLPTPTYILIPVWHGSNWEPDRLLLLTHFYDEEVGRDGELILPHRGVDYVVIFY